MALTINGVNIPSGSTVMVNGQAVNKLVCNGVEVWRKAQGVNFNNEVTVGPTLDDGFGGSWVPTTVKVTPSGNSLILSINNQAHSSVTNIIFQIDSVSLTQLKLILQSGPAQTSGNTWIYNKSYGSVTIGEAYNNNTYDLSTTFNWRGDLEIYGNKYMHSLYMDEYDESAYFTSLNSHPTTAEIVDIENAWSAEVTEVYSTEIPAILDIQLNSSHYQSMWYTLPSNYRYQFNIITSNSLVYNGWKAIGYTPADTTQIGSSIGNNRSQLVYI